MILITAEWNLFPKYPAAAAATKPCAALNTSSHNMLSSFGALRHDILQDEKKMYFTPGRFLDKSNTLSRISCWQLRQMNARPAQTNEQRRTGQDVGNNE